MSRTLIIGGGAIGLSVAYHLARRGAQEVLLLERHQLTSGTSWHAAGIVGPLRATPNMTRLASESLRLFPEIEAETGLSTGYRQTGGYWLARDPARLDELHRISDLGQTQGLSPQMIRADQVGLPMLDLSAHLGALHVPEDANVNPVDLCMAYARAARTRGVEIREGVQVAQILTDAGRATAVRLADGSVIEADRVVLCAGAWSNHLAQTAGIALPLQAVEHMYVVTQPIPGLPDPVPVIRDLDRGIYVKGDAGKLVIGGFEPDAKCWNPQGPEGDRPFLELPEDWDQFAPFMEAALELVPGLAQVGIQHFMNGPESFTNDTRPLVGEVPQVDGLFVAAGMNSVGVMSSAGIGRALADWITDATPPMDMWEVDIARADPKAATPAHMQARMQEAVSDLFAMHWPYKQPKAGRGLRHSALHGCWAEAGAVWGQTAGWERALYFGAAQGYSVGAQGWWPQAQAEAGVMAKGAALLDLAPMTKISLEGANVYTALEALTCRRLGPVGQVRFAPFLNARGGIEIDATVQSLTPTRVRITSPAATRQRDLAWLRRALAGQGVTIRDETEDFAILGLMGAGARACLEGATGPATGADLAQMRFGTFHALNIGGQEVLAQRLSYVGEYGYELWLPASGDAAQRIFSALHSAGAQPMGLYALDGCRIEKGFCHWGHDIGPEVTPLEAGLGFAIDWTKAFQGKAALEAQKASGLRQRLILLEVAGDPLLLHDEPVYEGGTCVGLTTSGARGPRTGLALCLAMVSVQPGERMAQTCARAFTVRVAGQDHSARGLPRPPFDPSGERMKP